MILNDEVYAKLINEGNLLTMLIAFHKHTSISSHIESGLRSIDWEVGARFGVAEIVAKGLGFVVVDNTDLSSTTWQKLHCQQLVSYGEF